MPLVARVRFLKPHALEYAPGEAFNFAADDRALVDVEIVEGLIVAGIADFLDVPPQSVDGVDVDAASIAAAAQRLADVEPPEPPAPVDAVVEGDSNPPTQE